MKKGRIINLCIIIMLVSFIWGQSCMSREESAGESGWIFENVINPVQEAVFGREVISHEGIRKCAHAFEFMCLAIAMTAYVGTLVKSQALCMMIAFLDETIQIFSGRGPSIIDVWIDSGGALIGVLAVVIFIRVFRRK
ncbi:MAG: VanZ family protein [Eubacteriales bacterium]|nr:VanZ family protein [Eubacteriales bacterium]